MIPSVIIVSLSLFGLIVSALSSARLPKTKLPLYPFVTLLGALLLLLFGILSPRAVLSSFTSDSAVNPLKILVLFFSMTALSTYLDEAGFFRFLAARLLCRTKGGQVRLFCFLFVSVSALTVFTSNDIVILTFTPFLCYFCKSGRIDPLPYLFGEFVAANTFSMALLIGNPTNIYLSLSQSIGFLPYLRMMWLPALFGGAAALLTMLILFRRRLADPITPTVTDQPLDRPRAILGGSILALATLALALSDLLPFEMWELSLFFFLLLFPLSLVLRLLRRKTGLPATLCRLPYLLIPFLLSMFVLVESLAQTGVCARLFSLFDIGAPIAVYGTLSTLLSNLFNNISMSVLFGSILSYGGGEAAAYASVIGSNIGAFLTPIGALAGILFCSILSANGIRMRFLDFCRYGVTVALPTLAASLFGLFLSLNIFS